MFSAQNAGSLFLKFGYYASCIVFPLLDQRCGRAPRPGPIPVYRENMVKLAIRTLRTAVVGLIVLGIVVFGSAGTLAYWQGWAFIIVFTISTNMIGVYLAIKDPVLLERRLKAGARAETRPLPALSRC